MGEVQAFIRLKLNTDDPIEMGEFVGAFTAIADEYDTFVRETRPTIDPSATLYVKEVKQGSIEAVLVPFSAGALPLFMQYANTLADFVRNYGAALRVYLKPNKRDETTTATQLRNFGDQVAAIANAPNASLEAAAIEVKNGEEFSRAAFKFKTSEAKSIRDHTAEHLREIERGSAAEHKRVLMTFTRTDVGDAKVGKRSGERVKIESVSARSLAVIFASEMAEQEIRYEIRDEKDNVYKKGFVVDVNVELRRGRPVAYRITNLHEVVDLPDEDDED